MLAISPILIAIFIGLVSFLGCFWWLGIVKRRQAEIQTGVLRLQASAQTKSKVQIGGAISAGLTILSFFIFDGIKALNSSSSDAKTETEIAQITQAVPTTAANRPVDPMLAKLNATAKAMDEIDKLTENQLAKRKADTAIAISALPTVNSAIWYSASTLQINLNTEKNDGKKLIDEICRVLTQREELRYTRLQLEPPSGSTAPVHFRQCL